MGFSIYHDFIVKSNTAKVYNAITKPEHLVNWWPLKCDGEPKNGAIYNFNFTDAYDWYAEVLSCKPSDHIHFKMKKADDDWMPTSFGYDLELKDENVLVKFWHKDWPECNNHFKHSSFCWALLLKGLKDYIEKGTIIPFEERS